MTGVYIAGAMRGRPAFGFHEFFAAEEWLRENTDFEPIFNPARRDEGLGFLAREWDLTGEEDLSQPIGVACEYAAFYDPDTLCADCTTYTFDLAAAMEADNDFIRSDECGAIVMLPGWGESVGARDELHLAESLGREVLYLWPEHYPGDQDCRRLLDIELSADISSARFYVAMDQKRRQRAALDQMVWDAEEDGLYDLDDDNLDTWIPLGEVTSFDGKPTTGTAFVKAINSEIERLRETSVFPPGDPSNGEVRVTSPTGGQKGQKPERLGLIPGEALDAIARVYAFGAEKYEAHNWRKGYAWSLSMDALLRHINEVNKGNWLDPETGQPHLAHAAFHLNTMLTWAATGQTDQLDLYGLEIPDAS